QPRPRARVPARVDAIATGDRQAAGQGQITLDGAVFVAVIAILPYIVLWVGNVSTFPFAGTTVLIAVGVALELMRQIDSQLMQRNYEGFLKQ
ncbi:MAG: hypothetical protein ACKOQX_06165, partial [Actinomycetota bacterium]